MMSDNPLSCGQLDEDVSDQAMYGYDAQGSSSTDSENNVIEPAANGDTLKSFVLERIDPLS